MASSMAELKAEIMAQIVAAMGSASEEILSAVKDETAGFYAGGQPSLYSRTGALGQTPSVSFLHVGSDDVSFEAYLDQSGGYSTGDNPSMAQVLDLANYGIRWRTASGQPANPAVGSSGFWERAEGQMQGILDKNIGSYFK